MKQFLIERKVLAVMTSTILVFSPFVYADDPPAGGNRGQGTLGGDQSGLRLNGSDRALEDALRGSGFIREPGASGSGTSGSTNSTAGGTQNTSTATYPITRTEQRSDGSTRTVTTNADGSRMVSEIGRSVEPRDLTMNFNKNGQVVSQNSTHSNGTVDTMTYNPATGVRDSVTRSQDGATTRMVSQSDGSSVMTQTGFNQNTITQTEDAQGHVVKTTQKPDGTKTVEEYTRPPERQGYNDPQPVTTTTTEYGVDGKPDSSVTETTERYGGGYRTTRREETQYNDRGKPIRTQVMVPGRFGGWDVIEEVTYWSNGYRRRIIRRDPSHMIRVGNKVVGRTIGVYYYNHLGNLERSSIEPGLTPGPPPTSGAWFVPRNQQQSSANTPSAGGESAFAQADNLGLGSFRETNEISARDMTPTETVFQEERHHQDQWYN